MALAPDGHADRRHQLVGGGDLQHAGEGAGRVATLGQLGVVMHRDEHDPRFRPPREEHRRRGNPVEAGHHDVGDDHVGADLVLGRQERPPITDCGNHVEVALEQPAQLFGDPGVILGQQDPRPIHALIVGGRHTGHNPEHSGGDP